MQKSVIKIYIVFTAVIAYLKKNAYEFTKYDDFDCKEFN